jgi:glycerol-3-phosphate dehydrogenase
MDAAERGATVLTRCACVDARRGERQWRLRLQGGDGKSREVTARALVNAAGPWAAQFLSELAHAPERKALRLVKGSHVVVKKLFEHDHAYIFQNPDKRIIFGIPYEGDFTLIGTTDVEHHGDIGAAHIDASEIEYLCEQASRYFERPVRPSDVVWSYSGVRPLLDDESGDPSAVTRDYELELDTGKVGAPAAPLLSVWGGKITTFRKLAEEAADLLCAPLSATPATTQARDHTAPRGAWTHGAFLPGGDLSDWIGKAQRPDADFLRFVQALALRHPLLPAPLRHRLARGYGSRVAQLLGDGALGAEVAPGLFEAELHYLHTHEWARSPEDVLWRRTKLGLHLSAAERLAVAHWCAAHWPPVAAQADAGQWPVEEKAWN